ncbi:MAG: tetratricopeptide repeat protein [Gemmatimonadaceae bacterium]
MTDTTEARWEQHNEAGRAYFAKGEFAQAEHAFIAAIREATTLGADNLRLAASLSSLGQLKYKQKDFPQAEALFRRSLAIRERVQGPDHYSVVQNINNLAALHFARGELDLAEPLFLRALAVSEKHLGTDHADVAVCLNNLARLYFRRNDFTAAAPLLMRLLAIREHALGGEHPEVAGILSSLVKVRYAEGQFDAAEQLCRRVLAIREKSLDQSDPAIATTLDSLAEICDALGKYDEELEVRERALKIRHAAMGADHQSVVAARGAIDTLRAQMKAGGPVRRAAPPPRPTPILPAVSVSVMPRPVPMAPPPPSAPPISITPMQPARVAASAVGVKTMSPSAGTDTITVAPPRRFTPQASAPVVVAAPAVAPAAPPPPTKPAAIEMPRLVGVSADMFAEPDSTEAPRASFDAMGPSTPPPVEFITNTPRDLSDLSFGSSREVTFARTGLESNRMKYMAAAAVIAVIVVGGLWYAQGGPASAKELPKTPVTASQPTPSTAAPTLSSGAGQPAPNGSSAQAPPPAPGREASAVRQASSSTSVPENGDASPRAARSSTAGAVAAIDPTIPRMVSPVDPARLAIDRLSKAIDDSLRTHIDSAGRALRLQNPTFQTKRPNVIGRP